MTSRRSPTIRRRRLGMELRRLREAAGLRIEQVADKLECSDSKISRIETAHVSATPRDVRDMLEIYGVNVEHRNELMQLAREARQKGWWHAYVDVPQTTYIGIEAEVTSIKTYQCQTVPGLMQIEDYARAVIHAVRRDLRHDEIERRVELRMVRQAILTQDDPPSLWTVLDEATLRRPIGGLDTMIHQLDHLIRIAALPNLTLQVLPFAAGEHAGMDGSFIIYGFAEPADPDIVHVENPASDLYLDNPTTVSRYEFLFDHLRAAALSPDDSSAFLTGLLDELSK